MSYDIGGNGYDVGHRSSNIVGNIDYARDIDYAGDIDSAGDINSDINSAGDIES